MSDYISRQAAIDALDKRFDSIPMEQTTEILLLRKDLRDLQSVQPERLTDDDFETIRIHLNAYKGELCNQRRWKEAFEYQRIIDRFLAFASAQPEPLTDKEQRIFLAAMGREEKVCKQVDEGCRDCGEPYEDSLVWACHEIMRKVKKALWET